MEKGLFSRLQSYFSSSYGGRYVEYLLKETIEEQPKLAVSLFGAKKSDKVQAEYRFRVGTQTRIADLVLLDAETERPTCLVEIKYDDHKNPKNRAQLKHYLSFCEANNAQFVFLSQHVPPDSLRKTLVGRGKLVLFSGLAEKLSLDEGSVENLLRRFFVDKGLMMHEFNEKDLANLKSFLFRFGNPWGGQGRTQNKAAMSGGAAEAFGYLLKNMNIVARGVTANAHDRLPTLDFQFEPWINVRKIQKNALKESEAPAVNAWNAKGGGRLYVFGRTPLSNKMGWLNVEFGVVFDVNPGEKEFDFFTFSLVNCKAFKGKVVYKEQKASISLLSDKRRATTVLKKRIGEAIGRAIEREELPKSQRIKLKTYLADLD